MNSFIFMVNCCTLSTNSVLIKCAKGMGGGGCVGGFFFHSPLSVVLVVVYRGRSVVFSGYSSFLQSKAN